MKPPPFEYFSPSSVSEVVDLLARYGAEARILAGGQSLVPLLNLRLMRPSVLIDINRCQGLGEIEPQGDVLAVGPIVRQITAVRSEQVQRLCPLIAQALSWAGPVAVRARATVGGTLAHADRVAELPAVALALGCTLEVESVRGKRLVPAEEFFLGDLATAIREDEFLRGIRFPQSPPGSRSAFLEVSVRQEGVAVVGLAAQLQINEGFVQHAALVAMGVGSVPVRLAGAEQLLLGQRLNREAIEASSRSALQDVDPADDPYASAGYRRYVVGQLLQKALNSFAIVEVGHER